MRASGVTSNQWVEVLRPGKSQRIDRLSVHELEWKYRHSHGWQPGIIVRMEVSWPLHRDELILDKIKLANRQRMETQPLEWPSCGSVFKNPLPQKAGALIESCGLKGFTVGGAQVLPKHANFIINRGDATAEDIAAVIEHVQRTVQKMHGVLLQTEVVRLGF